MTKVVSILLTALSLAACSQEVPNIPSATPVPTPGTTQADPSTKAAPSAERIPANAFTFVLSDVDCSQTPVAVATVKWDAGVMAAGGVSIFVESPDNPRKLWAEAAQKDQATTGKWVFAGSRFTLQERATGVVLAQRTVDRIPCPSP
jgi:hypothetical protein